ncbi:hypothetical protein [Natrinema pallidum]|uniref:hypothetical protein n=1 Tax=Natrinema pallidum TaxID=69527 RepID=UPI0013918B87|nr:hypothetical protein [Natrinema pallidum]
MTDWRPRTGEGGDRRRTRGGTIHAQGSQRAVADRHDCSEAAVSCTISPLHDAGVIEHKQGFVELTDD